VPNTLNNIHHTNNFIQNKDSMQQFLQNNSNISKDNKKIQPSPHPSNSKVWINSLNSFTSLNLNSSSNSNSSHLNSNDNVKNDVNHSSFRMNVNTNSNSSGKHNQLNSNFSIRDENKRNSKNMNGSKAYDSRHSLTASKRLLTTNRNTLTHDRR
jgi:hypothetical protein